ncbi:MAG: helix-turn-helix domain-containing protein [Coriobacteriia bacterium]
MKGNHKLEWEKLLFTVQNLSQVEIAEKTGVSKVTINKWVKKYKWEEEKSSLTVTREQQLQRLYLQIAAINEDISQREQKYPTSKEADTINKIASAIDKMERESSLSDIISVSKKVLNWLRAFDLDKAKEMSGIFDAFIKDSLK